MAAKLPVLSLFSGAGCLDLAVERCAEPFGSNGSRAEGALRVAVATDHDERALRTLHANFPGVPTLHGDIRCLLYTSPSPRDRQKSRMPSSA